MPSLPVLLDATSIPPNRGGVARYIAGLLQGLDEVGVRVGVVVKHEDLAWLRGIAPGHVYTPAPRWTSSRPLRLVWEQFGLPGLLARSGAPLLHSPHYTFPISVARRSVVTLHDATFFSDPDAHGTLKRRFFRTWIRLARRIARATVTPSAATWSEIRRFVRGGAGRNVVAHLGVDRAVFHEPTDADLAAFRTAHGLRADEPWIAFLGTVEPRKRVGDLIRAHGRLRATADADADAVPTLLVAGGLGWDADARALLEDAGDVPGAPVRALGYLPIEELSALLGGAEVVAYPSIGEGFGLPVLEAMACGTCVLTTDRLALGEVGGDAVAYTEPDTDAIERSLAQLLADDDRRAELARAGAERAAGFTWAACAEAHRAVYAA